MCPLYSTTCLAPPTELSLTSVAEKDSLNTTGALVLSTKIILSVPSKLNLSSSYLSALVRPVSIAVQLSETLLFTKCSAAVVLEVALVTPVKVVDVLPV